MTILNNLNNLNMKEPLIAARMAAEPGWRAVSFEARGEELMIMLFVVAWWGYPAPTVVLPKPGPIAQMRIFAGLFSDVLGGMLGGRGAELVPMTAEGKQLSPRWLVPPCGKSNEEIVAECKAWVAEVVALNPELKSPTGGEP